ALIFGEDICNQIPGCVGEFIPLCHLGLLALMAVYFTENRISWVYVQSLKEQPNVAYRAMGEDYIHRTYVAQRCKKANWL
ncbi:hypothetical protein, partial [Pseudomonas lundensis]|uniref:hypothetical protein n=1 Tax=Pseudomonas lundensis TaxID=86185 RepID=UPI001CB720CC